MNFSKPVALFMVIVFLGFSLIGCQPTIPKDALALSSENLADRQLQTRVFDTTDEKMLLMASAQLLQDLGYTIEESETSCGVIVCSRDRDVTDAGQIVGSLAMALLLGVYVPVDRNQKVLASLVTKPIDNKRIDVRITFQHMVWNTDNQLIINEQINDPEIYQEFFSKLSKSLFLTAHEI